MVYFFASVGMLILGYFVYGTMIDRLFGADHSRPTPAVRMEDGVDYVRLPTWKIFLIQLLNIAGLGPIYGPILGALYGPVALLWIVFGCIFAGAVHDYFSGMLSVRYDGKSIPDVVGRNLGIGFQQFMRIFSVIVLILVGVVFFLGPAALLQNMTGLDLKLLIGIIIGYYFLATILPVDKIIGRVYPLFGAVLIFMAVGTIAMLIVKGYEDQHGAKQRVDAADDLVHRQDGRQEIVSDDDTDQQLEVKSGHVLQEGGRPQEKDDPHQDEQNH